MRMDQRHAQRELDEQCKDDEDMETHFCLLCRLNYRSEKAEHQGSEAHKKMKRFLMPYCNVCRIGFKGPMVYEMHRCSLEHIKVISFLISHDSVDGKCLFQQIKHSFRMCVQENFPSILVT